MVAFLLKSLRIVGNREISLEQFSGCQQFSICRYMNREIIKSSSLFCEDGKSKDVMMSSFIAPRDPARRRAHGNPEIGFRAVLICFFGEIWRSGDEAQIVLVFFPQF